MTDDQPTSLRRQFLKLGLTGSVLGTSGCMRTISGGDDQSTPARTATENPTKTQISPDLSSAQFSFDYDSQVQRVTIQFNGGASITAGNLQIREAGGKQVSWPELGSTLADTNQQLDSGATAVLGPNILNWNQPVENEATIRLVFTGQDTPATLGRFSPPETTTLTTTLPETSRSTTTAPDSPPVETPTRTPSLPTPSHTPTDTPTTTSTQTTSETTTTTPEDTTPPSISGFSITHESNQQLRISFTSDEPLATIQVSLSGAETTTLRTADFTETTAGSSYSYETTYAASVDGRFTATLEQATDQAGNSSQSNPTNSVTVDTTAPSISAFSIANPSGKQLRISFDSTEQLSTIQVSVSGAESTSLITDDFSRDSTSEGVYTYEATYNADSNGDYTATLEKVVDKAGNANESGQSIDISIEASGQWDLVEDFEQYSVGTELRTLDNWTRISGGSGKYYEVEKSSISTGGQKAAGTAPDSGTFEINAKNTSIEPWNYPDTGFRLVAILSTEGEQNVPNVGVLGENGAAGVELNNHPYGGKGINFSYFDNKEEITSIEAQSYEIEVVGQPDQTVIASIRPLGSSSWNSFSRNTDYDGEIKGVRLNTNDGGQMDSIRLRKETDPQPSGKWDLVEDFEQYSIGTELRTLDNWTRISGKSGKYYAIEESSSTAGGEKAVGIPSDSGTFEVNAKNTSPDSWNYPSTGFRLRAILNTEDDANQPKVSVLGESGTAGVELDNHPYGGTGIAFSYFDGNEVISSIEAQSYEIEIVGQSDQTIIASIRPVGDSSWESFSRGTSYDGKIKGVGLNTNNGGQMDSIRFRKEADPQPSGNK